MCICRASQGAATAAPDGCRPSHMRGQPIETLQRQQTAVSQDAPGKPSSISSRRRASLSGACASSSSQASGWPGGYLPGMKCEAEQHVTKPQLSGLAPSISNSSA